MIRRLLYYSWSFSHIQISLLSPPDEGGEATASSGEAHSQAKEEEEEEFPRGGSLAELLLRLGLVPPGAAAERETPPKQLTEFSLKGIADIILKIQSSEISERTKHL